MSLEEIPSISMNMTREMIHLFGKLWLCVDCGNQLKKDGGTTHFWLDNWLLPRQRICYFVSNIPEDIKGGKLIDFVEDNLEWNFTLLKDLL